MLSRPRSSRRQLAELSFILRAILDELAAAPRGPKDKAHRAALDLVDAFVSGESPSLEAVASLSAGLDEAVKGLGVSSPPLWKALYSLPVGALLRSVERGEDMSALVLTQTRYAIRSASDKLNMSDLEALQARAKTHAAAVDDSPLPAFQRRASPVVVAKEAVLLARSQAGLSGEALALLDFAQAERDAAQTAERAKLAKRLDDLGLPSTEPVLAFEESFGGLLLPNTMYDDWREDRIYTLVGTWAMLETHSSLAWEPTGETPILIPVARGTQEDFYYLDEHGAAYWHLTINDPSPKRFGANGAELLTRLLIGSLTYAAIELAGTAVTCSAAHVADCANEIGLARLFADDSTEWWSGPAASIAVVNGMVWGVARTPEAIAVLNR